jgi:hypothetical protein
LGVEGGGFLRYASRETGINLVWSESPVPEWEVTGGSIGADVRTGQRVALLNTAHGDHMVYGERDEGINLRWYADIRLGFLQPFANYPPLPIPNRLRAPAREATQIQLVGEARQVTLFHGQIDDELDWHVYLSISPEDRRTLTRHLRAHARGAGSVTERDLDQPYCELMVLDALREPFIGDDRFFSADVRRAFALPRAAWDYSETAGDEQGDSIDLTGDSRLTVNGAKVLLQGCFVNDVAHGLQPELHPLDSIAYALDEQDRPLRIGPDDPAWPESIVTWRVAAFTNSTVHRIGSADYVRQERRVTWFLDLPSRARPPRVTIETTYPGFVNRGRGAEDVDDRRPTADEDYESDGKIADSARLERDPRDGITRLRVDVRMAAPDRWGGMFLAEYTVQPREWIVDGRTIEADAGLATVESRPGPSTRGRARRGPSRRSPTPEAS